MIVALILAGAALALPVGVILGQRHARARAAEVLRAARYLDAIALASDLLVTPDSLDLRPRAEKIVAAHRAAQQKR